MPTLESLTRGVATVLLVGPWDAGALAERLAGAFQLARRPRWTRPLADRVMAHFGQQPPVPRYRQLTMFLQRDVRFRRACERMLDSGNEIFVETLGLPAPEMRPAANIPGTDQLPALVTPGRLAAWLNVTPAELDWLADCHRRERHAPSEKLRHYRYRWIAKAGGRKRLVEAPKPRLKEIQRRILDEILSQIPPHESAQAFVSGRSPVTFVAPHAGRRVVLKIDLRDFFPSVRGERVFALYRTIGYPEEVSRLLAGLCTNSVPDEVLSEAASAEELESWRTKFSQPHLPQGAPTSPALANLCAYRLDCRLSGLAKRAGAAYTRYADDLLFSGDVGFARSLPRFRVLVCAILLNEGFEIRRRKTRVMRSGARQEAAGLVMNQRPNIAREETDRLKAVLHNCRRFGPASQNRAGHPCFREHLLGRVAYLTMVHPARGTRLRELFNEIDWN